MLREFTGRFPRFTWGKIELVAFAEPDRNSPSMLNEESQLGYMFRRRRYRTPHETADRPSTRRRPVRGDTAAAVRAAAAGDKSLLLLRPSSSPNAPPLHSTPDCLLNTAEAESVDTTERASERAERSRIIKIITQIFNPIHTNI